MGGNAPHPGLERRGGRSLFERKGINCTLHHLLAQLISVVDFGPDEPEMKVDPKKKETKKRFKFTATACLLFPLSHGGERIASAVEGCESLEKRIPISIWWITMAMAMKTTTNRLRRTSCVSLFSPSPSSLPTNPSVKNGMKEKISKRRMASGLNASSKRYFYPLSLGLDQFFWVILVPSALSSQ